ncbi:MAG: diguanylate cyclase, partial [Neisseriaceae bacterium]
QGHGRPIRITASVGIALYPEDGNSAELLLRRADLAMYQAKHAGKDQFCFYRDCPPNADEGGLPG